MTLAIKIFSLSSKTKINQLTVNHVSRELHNTDALKEEHKNIFHRNYQYYIERELKDCVVRTKESKILGLQIHINGNEITSTYLQSHQNILFREIKCTIYKTGISCKEIMDGITTTKQENRNRKQ